MGFVISTFGGGVGPLGEGVSLAAGGVGPLGEAVSFDWLGGLGSSGAFFR